MAHRKDKETAARREVLFAPICFFIFFLLSAGRALTSDWSVNSFIMVVYENFFHAKSEFSVQSTSKIFLISGGSRIFQRQGANLLLGKMKEIGPRGRVFGAELGSANAHRQPL